jgi:hypothetical protein
MALADAWENADGWPVPLAAALAGDPALAGSEVLLALPEQTVPLLAGGSVSDRPVRPRASGWRWLQHQQR